MKLTYFAQNLKLPGGDIEGPVKGPEGQPLNTLGDIISLVLPILISISGVILFLILVWGGINIMTSSGDPEKIKSGKSKITTSLVGFALLVFSYLIVKLISNIFGIGTDLF